MSVDRLLRSDLRIIAGLVPYGSRVLDLGCGDGALLQVLRDQKEAFVRGVEISHEGVAACIARGLSVIQADLDQGLTGFPDGSFDLVVLSQTLQVIRRPRLVVGEMLRVGARGIVSYPNFGHWWVRVRLGLLGRMPMSKTLPYQWYDTPNIHLTTVKDFRDFCRHEGLRIEREITVVGHNDGSARRITVMPNLRAELGIVEISKAAG